MGERFENLFVDDDFGALDPAGLDDAIESLPQFRISDWMVDGITQIEGSKQVENGSIPGSLSAISPMTEAPDRR